MFDIYLHLYVKRICFTTNYLLKKTRSKNIVHFIPKITRGPESLMIALGPPNLKPDPESYNTKFDCHTEHKT